MKRASYREGIEVIALNDNPSDLDPESVVGLCTVMLLAEIFGVTQERVANDVVAFRSREAGEPKKPRGFQCSTVNDDGARCKLLSGHRERWCNFVAGPFEKRPAKEKKNGHR